MVKYGVFQGTELISPSFDNVIECNEFVNVKVGSAILMELNVPYDISGDCDIIEIRAII